MTMPTDSNCSPAALKRECNGYNVAFCALGLEWYWDAEAYSKLEAIAEPKRRVRTYLETHQPHLLRAHDADFLVDAVEAMGHRFGPAADGAASERRRGPGGDSLAA